MFKREHFWKDKDDKRCSFCGHKVRKYTEIKLSKTFVLIGCDNCTGYDDYHFGIGNSKEAQMYPKYLKQTDGLGLDLYQDYDLPQKIFDYMKSNFWVCARVGKEVDSISNWMMSIDVPTQKPRRGYEWRRPNLAEATDRQVYALKYPKHFENVCQPWVQCSQNIIPWHEPRCSDYKWFWQQKKIEQIKMERAKEKAKREIQRDSIVRVDPNDKLSDDQYAQMIVMSQAGDFEVIENTDGTITLEYK